MVYGGSILTAGDVRAADSYARCATCGGALKADPLFAATGWRHLDLDEEKGERRHAGVPAIGEAWGETSTAVSIPEHLDKKDRLGPAIKRLLADEARAENLKRGNEEIASLVLEARKHRPRRSELEPGAADCVRCGETLYLTRTLYWRHVVVDRAHESTPMNRVHGLAAASKITAAFENQGGIPNG